MLSLFLMMIRHILNIVDDYRDFLIDDVQKLMMHNDDDEQIAFLCMNSQRTFSIFFS